MKAPVATAAALILLALASPASACRRFSIWHYNFQQPRCPLAGQEVKALVPSTTVQPTPALDIPLPDLTQIIWGDVGDERLRAITLLRALNNSPSR